MSNNKNKPNWLYNCYNIEQGIHHELIKGVNAQVFLGSKSMLSLVQVDPHTQGKIHSHPEEQWGFLLEGKCVRIQDGIEVPVKIGDFWYTPSNVQHGIRSEKEPVVILEFFSPVPPQYSES